MGEPKAPIATDALGRVLYVADVARILRVSLSTARAFLGQLEQRSEGDLVHRRGRKLCITERALNAVLSGGEAGPSLRRHVAALDRQVRRLARRVEALESLFGSESLSKIDAA
jgi:hypothetical protein